MEEEVRDSEETQKEKPSSGDKSWRVFVERYLSTKSAPLLILAGLLVIGVGSWLVYTYATPDDSDDTQPAPQEQTQSTSSGGDFVDEIERASANPVKEQPNTNPVDRVNPFSGAYKNPFE